MVIKKKSYVKTYDFNHLKEIMSLTLNVIPRLMVLNIISEQVSDHMCYIIRSTVSNKVYIGYTTNFDRRLRQHNGEIKGGAKRTIRGRPWVTVCLIKGFYEKSSALRFEYRLQHPGRRKKSNEDSITFTINTLNKIINDGDGSVAKDNKIPWPHLTIHWCSSEYIINHHAVTNNYGDI